MEDDKLVTERRDERELAYESRAGHLMGNGGFDSGYQRGTGGEDSLGDDVYTSSDTVRLVDLKAKEEAITDEESLPWKGDCSHNV